MNRGRWLFTSRAGAAARLTFIAAFTIAGCGADTENGHPPAEARTVQVGSENVVLVKRDRIVVGPVISGELKPEREATVRAELGGSMLEVSADQGQAVRKGALLGRIESKALEDMRLSVSSAVHAAESQLAVARREAERTSQLVIWTSREPMSPMPRRSSRTRGPAW